MRRVHLIHQRGDADRLRNMFGSIADLSLSLFELPPAGLAEPLALDGPDTVDAFAIWLQRRFSPLGVASAIAIDERVMRRRLTGWTDPLMLVARMRALFLVRPPKPTTPESVETYPIFIDPRLDSLRNHVATLSADTDLVLVDPSDQNLVLMLDLLTFAPETRAHKLTMLLSKNSASTTPGQDAFDHAFGALIERPRWLTLAELKSDLTTHGTQAR